MHEVFLCRLAAHPKLRKDENFKVFLEYKQEVKKQINVHNIYIFCRDEDVEDAFSFTLSC
jgi:hypothetical protein